MKRRDVLLFSLGGTLALAGGGAVWSATRTPDAALAPWRQAAGLAADDPRLFAFGHAILAPNPHNRQPWTIRLLGDDAAEIRCDLDRRLPETDPEDRQIAIGFGCFLELARLAAASIGWHMDVVAFPLGAGSPRLDARPVARATFRRDPARARDPLFEAASARRSTKEPFDMARPVGAAALAALLAVPLAGATVAGTTDAGRVSALRAVAWQAWEIEAATDRTWMESVRLMRIGKAEIEASPDGIDLGGPLFEALRHAGLMTRAKLADRASTAYLEGRRAYEALFAATPGFVWLATPGNSRADQLAAGAAYLRLNLAATAQGLAFHPVSQALQEFPEMRGAFAALHDATGVAAPARVQMLARIGYAAAVPPSPRWALATRLERA